jgi:DNA-binding transcriptional LysR family regulator
MYMHKCMNKIDWDLIRAFEATARTGSLSAAARALGLTQPTLSRQIAALEASLGLTLFDRIGKRLLLTPAADNLLDHARSMSEAAGSLALAAAGQAQEIEGTVTVSTSDGVAAFLMPEIVARIRREWPQIAIHLLVSNEISDLQRREADIAVRHVRPEHPDLIGKLIAETAVHLFASQGWIDANGLPQSLAEIDSQDMLAYAPTDQFVSHLKDCGMPLSPGDFRLVSQNSVVLWALARQGLGVCAMLRDIGERTAGMVCLLPDKPLFSAPLWLVSHRHLRTNRRCRIVFDVIAAELSAVFGKRPGRAADSQAQQRHGQLVRPSRH